MAFVAIIMGSDSDLPVLEKTMDILDQLQIRREAKV
jgi:5-(carboxyamino)imidazole ribonucleotide mutase